MSGDLREAASGIDIQIQFVADPQNECAGILQSPGNVRKHHMSVGGKRVTAPGDGKRQRNLVVSTVQFEQPGNVEGGLISESGRPRNPGGSECGFRIFRALQNLFVHFSVTCVAAGIAACDIDRDQPACLTGRRIEMNYSALQLEGAIHGMQDIAKGKSDGGLRRVKFKREVLRKSADRGGSCQQK